MTATVKVAVGGDSVEDIPVLPVVAAEDQLPETLTLKVNGDQGYGSNLELKRRRLEPSGKHSEAGRRP